MPALLPTLSTTFSSAIRPEHRTNSIDTSIATGIHTINPTQPAVSHWTSHPQPLEPILIPKLRIHFADFPYSRYSIRPEAIHLGDLLRLSVRPGPDSAPPDFHGAPVAHPIDQRVIDSVRPLALSLSESFPGPSQSSQPTELFKGPTGSDYEKAVKKKRQLSWGQPSPSPSSLALPPSL